MANIYKQVINGEVVEFINPQWYVKEKWLRISGVSGYFMITKTLNSFKMNLKYADSKLYNLLLDNNLLSNNTDIFNSDWIEKINNYGKDRLTADIFFEVESIFIC